MLEHALHKTANERLPFQGLTDAIHDVMIDFARVPLRGEALALFDAMPRAEQLRVALAKNRLRR